MDQRHDTPVLTRRQLLTAGIGAMCGVALNACERPLASRAVPAASDPPPAGQPKKRVLSAADFKYLGAIRLPQDLTSYCSGAMTARRVGGRLQFFMTGENSSGAAERWGTKDIIWELADPGSYALNHADAPRAEVLTRWGDVYQDKRVSFDADGRPFSLEPYQITSGLAFKNGYLYWSYYDWYNVSGRQDWCIGLTMLGDSPATMRAHGPWRPDVGVKHSAGWLVDLPDGSLGVGAPLIGGNIGSSWGPELTGGGTWPAPGVPSGPRAPDLRFPDRLVGYGFPGGNFTPEGAVVRGRRLPSLTRDGNYVWHDPRESPGKSGVIVEVNPALNGGVGSFTAIDSVANCLYIDLPNKHGVLFGGSVGVGHIWYGYVNDCGHGLGNPCSGGQGPNASGFEPRWWMYDPEQCADVARGRLQPNLVPNSEINPQKDIHALQLGCNRNFGGSYFDRETRRLYMVARGADETIPGLFLPLLHVFEVV